MAGPVPRHLRDAHYPGARGLGHGRGYAYPHDDPRGVLTQQYPPDDATGRDYYRPTNHGAERAVAERLSRLRRIVRGTPGGEDVSGTASGSELPGTALAGNGPGAVEATEEERR